MTVQNHSQTMGTKQTHIYAGKRDRDFYLLYYTDGDVTENTICWPLGSVKTPVVASFTEALRENNPC